MQCGGSTASHVSSRPTPRMQKTRQDVHSVGFGNLVHSWVRAQPPLCFKRQHYSKLDTGQFIGFRNLYEFGRQPYAIWLGAAVDAPKRLRRSSLGRLPDRLVPNALAAVPVGASDF